MTADATNSVRSMGNKKNKLHHRNGHRHVYTRKNLPGQKGKDSTQRDTPVLQPTVAIEGSRIINIQKLVRK